MRALEKEHRKLRKQFNESKEKTTKFVSSKKMVKEEVPEWFDKELKNEEMTDDDKEELDKLLNSTFEKINSINN